jgi:large conductance mechanosensitive channel
MGLVQEFKKFAMRGNVIDLAVGVIIGGAFGKITTSLVNDIIMPPIGMAISGVNFKDLKIVIKEATEAAPAVAINYGNFLQTTFDFVIIAIAIFAMIKGINALQTKEEPAAPATPPPPPADVVLLTEIRDLLKK